MKDDYIYSTLGPSGYNSRPLSDAAERHHSKFEGVSFLKIVFVAILAALGAFIYGYVT